MIEERSAGDLCGYPLCSEKRSKIKGKYKISLKESKLMTMDELTNYCSKECLASCRYLVSQMSEEPSYVRARTPKIQLLKFKSQQGNQAETNLESCMEELTIKERAGNAFDPSKDCERFDSVRDVSSVKVPKEKEVKVTWKDKQKQTNQIMKDLDHLMPAGELEENLHQSSQYSNSGESEDESKDISEDESEKGWFVPSRKKITMELSDFAKIWLYLDRLITNYSKLVISGKSFPLIKLDSECTARLNIFSKNILLALKSIQKDYRISLLLKADLLNLLKSFNYMDFSCVLSAKENWILTAVFLKAISINSDDLTREFEGKWEQIIQKTTISIDQFNTLCKAFY